MKYILLAPILVFASMFVFWPLVELFIISMYKTDFISSYFVGLKNYFTIFNNVAFTQSIINSVFYMVLIVAMTTLLSLTITFLVFRETKKWHDITRIVVYLPMLSAGVIISQIWRWIFNVRGPINWILGTDIEWFSQGITAIPAISLVMAFTISGSHVIIFLASILSIPKDLFEAAQIDGASWKQIYLFIILPHILPIVAVMMLVSAIAAPQIFEFIYALAPFEHSSTMAWSIYVEAFQMGRHGTAAAMSVVLLFMLLVLSWLKTRLQHDEQE